jgi:plastocyanin
MPRHHEEAAMPDWSIKIHGNPATFTPDIDDTPPNTPLKVVQGDLVSWNNMTSLEHWPVPDDPQTYGQFITEPIEPNSSSTEYNIISAAGTVIKYHCRNHPNERGQIVVVNFGC